MKKKIEVGSQLDINAAFDGGAVDTSVTYSVPADQQDIITVDANGVVTAVAVGTGTVEIKDAASGDLLRAVVFQVLSAADFAIQSDLDSGVTGLSVETAEVSQAPAFSTVGLITPVAMTATPQNGYDVLLTKDFAPYWQTTHTLPTSDALKIWDGNASTKVTLASDFVRTYTWMTIALPAAEAVKRIEIDFENIQGVGDTEVLIYATNSGTTSVASRLTNASWANFGTYNLSGNSVFTIQNNQAATMYSVIIHNNGTSVDVSGVRLYNVQ